MQTFVDAQIVTSSDELNIVRFGRLYEGFNVIIIKTYLYPVLDNGLINCIKKLTEIKGYYSSLLFLLNVLRKNVIL